MSSFLKHYSIQVIIIWDAENVFKLQVTYIVPVRRLLEWQVGEVQFPHILWANHKLQQSSAESAKYTVTILHVKRWRGVISVNTYCSLQKAHVSAYQWKTKLIKPKPC